MYEDRTARGENYTCFHSGPMNEWTQFRLSPPDVPMPAKGKLFLKELLGSTGMEISLNLVPPGRAIPFLHRHERNDEIYAVIGGQGQFLVDGDVIDVAEGSVLRVLPPGARAWRNTSDAPLYFLCIQHRADSVIEGGTIDGRKVEGEPNWER